MTTRWSPPPGLFRRDPTVVTHHDVEGPPLTAAMVDAVQDILGVSLPGSYVALMELCNGGYLVGELGCPTSEPTT